MPTSILYINILNVSQLPVVCLRWPPEVTVSVCWAHGLLFVVGVMCSPVYCLSPPFLLHPHCFSYSTCVSLVTLLVCLPIYPPGVCSPVLIRCFTLCVCYVCLYCSSLPARLTARLPVCLFPPGVVSVHFSFIWLLKRPILPALWVLTSSLLMHHDRTDQPHED